MPARVQLVLLLPCVYALQVQLSMPTRRSHGAAMAAGQAELAPQLCLALQNGEAPADLQSTLATSGGRRSFFSDYFTGDYTCADAEEPPRALIDTIMGCADGLLVVDAILTHVMSGAAASDERRVARATLLVNALWERTPAVQESCKALSDALAQQHGETVAVGWDQQYEYLRDNWLGLLAFTSYDGATLGRVRAALVACGGAAAEAAAEAEAESSAVAEEEEEGFEGYAAILRKAGAKAYLGEAEEPADATSKLAALEAAFAAGALTREMFDKAKADL